MILGNMTAVLNAAMAPSGMVNEGQECSGATQAVNDMLMSSYGGVLRLFSVWPQGQDASFEGLRAKGAFVVSGAVAGGVVAPVRLVSEVGAQATLASPWQGQAVKVTDSESGQPVPATQDPATGYWTFATAPMGTYTIESA